MSALLNKDVLLLKSKPLLAFTQAAQQAQQQDFANKANLLGQTSALQAGLGTGAQTLAGAIGKERQAQQQKLADATVSKALQRFGQLLTGVAGGAALGQDKYPVQQGGGK